MSSTSVSSGQESKSTHTLHNAFTIDSSHFLSHRLRLRYAWRDDVLLDLGRVRQSKYASYIVAIYLRYVVQTCLSMPFSVCNAFPFVLMTGSGVSCNMLAKFVLRGKFCNENCLGEYLHSPAHADIEMFVHAIAPNSCVWSVRSASTIKTRWQPLEQLILTLTGHPPSCLGSVGRGDPS